MKFAIKKIITSTEESTLNEIIGTNFSLTADNLLAELLSIEDKEDYGDYFLLMAIKEPVEFEEIQEKDFLSGKPVTKQVPIKFSEASIDYFNIKGESLSGLYFLDELSITRIKNDMIVLEENFEELEIDCESGNSEDAGKIFKKILEDNGYSIGNDAIFVSISDSVANSSIIPEEHLREEYELNVDWVYRIREISDDGDLYSKERALGSIKYVHKKTKEILKRDAFLAPFDEDMITINCEQIESIRPANDEELKLWFVANQRQPDIFPLLINEELDLVVDPDLEKTSETESEPKTTTEDFAPF